MPFYDVYETADGRWLSVAAIEPRFYADFARLLELPASLDRNDRATWPQLRTAITEAIRRRTRDEWVSAAAGLDACIAPVLTPAEAPTHPQHAARGTFVEVGGITQPGPAPRFARTPGRISGPPPAPGEHTDAALTDWGVPGTTVAQWREEGAIT